jgi:hypothetical protein
MAARGQIDRRKHEVDIAERVLGGGVWTGPAPIGDAHLVAIDLDVTVWPSGSSSSTVQVKRFGDRQDHE